MTSEAQGAPTGGAYSGRAGDERMVRPAGVPHPRLHPARVIGRLRPPPLSPQDRWAVTEALMVAPTVRAIRRFSILMLLSVVVAAVGLLQSSAAAVIGAMMIAPLMAPIMGVAASLVMGWGARLLTGLAIVSGSVAGCILIAWLLAQFLPAAGTGLPAEVLARSSPDVRDLLVALAAGGAGAYATVRRDMSGTLPGVAVAVALVPPLASVGVLLGRDQRDLARGAALLFVANLFGIVLAAAIVFVATGFVPRERIATNPRHVLAVLLAATIPTLAVGTVLTWRFLAIASDARDLEVATTTVVQWLGSGEDLNRVAITGSTVEVNLTGRASPPPVPTLNDALTAALGRPTTVDLRWIPVKDPTPTTTPVPVLALNQIRPVAEAWLAEQGLQLDGLGYDTTSLVVAASGDHTPERGEDLTARIAERFAVDVPVSLSWTRIDPAAAGSAGSAGAADTAAALARAREIAEVWATAHPGAAVLAVDRTGGTILVTVLALDRPATSDLDVQLRAALPRMAFTVQWVTGTVTSYSTPALSPTPAPATAPAPATP